MNSTQSHDPPSCVTKQIINEFIYNRLPAPLLTHLTLYTGFSVANEEKKDLEKSRTQVNKLQEFSE